jgi:hypothetical protein
MTAVGVGVSKGEEERKEKRPKKDRGLEQQAGRGEIWCIEKLEKGRQCRATPL